MSGTTVLPAHVYRPSTARLVVLDGFVPVPRGAVAAPPVMPSWPVKDPADVLDYAVDVSAAVAGDDGDAVVNVSVVTAPDATGDLTLNSAAMDGSLVVLWFGAGLSGTIYTATLAITLSSGRVVSRSIALPVYSLSGPSPTSTVLVTDTGQDMTDNGGNPIVVGS
jgi:hypothetical protein